MLTSWDKESFSRVTDSKEFKGIFKMSPTIQKFSLDPDISRSWCRKSTATSDRQACAKLFNPDQFRSDSILLCKCVWVLSCLLGSVLTFSLACLFISFGYVGPLWDWAANCTKDQLIQDAQFFPSNCRMMQNVSQAPTEISCSVSLEWLWQEWKIIFPRICKTLAEKVADCERGTPNLLCKPNRKFRGRNNPTFKSNENNKMANNQPTNTIRSKERASKQASEQVNKSKSRMLVSKCSLKIGYH